MHKEAKGKVSLIALISLILTLSSVGGCSSSPEEGLRVKRIIDGDTIELENGEVVRYIGIDTPETRRREGQEWIYDPQPFAEESAQFNRELVEGKRIRLEYDVVRRDRFNRILAYVYVGDLFVNAEMLKQGYAMLYTRPPNVKYIDLLVRLQRQARESNRGLWAGAQADIIPHYEAANYIGEIKTIEGKVLSTYESEKVIFLNFGQDYKTDFTMVIFKSNLSLFTSQGISPVDYYKDKRVKVWGLIKEYNGPEIIVNHPSQIEVLR